MKRIRIATVIGLLLVLTPPGSTVLAETEFEKWNRQRQGDYRGFLEKRDAEFSKFLEDAWKEMELQRGVVRDPAPKPVDIPVARIDEPPARPDPKVRPQPRPAPAPPPVPIVRQPPPPPPPPAIRPPAPPGGLPDPRPQPRPTPRVQTPEPVAPPPAPTRPRISVPTPPMPAPEPVVTPQVAAPVTRDDRKVNVEFYGHALEVVVDRKLGAQLDSPTLDNKSISRYFATVSGSNYKTLLQQVGELKSRLELNDWGYVLLLDRVAEAIHKRREHERALLIWFVLLKTGYQARVGYDDKDIYLLLPSQQQLYDVDYLSLSGDRYYGLTFDGKRRRLGRLYTYEGTYPAANKALNLSLKQGPLTRMAIDERRLSFRYQNQQFEVPVYYDRHTVDFLATYPQMDLEWYSEFQPRRETFDQLLSRLKQLVEGKDELEAANIILRFVQTAFRYATDQQQFGQENYLFPEETLYFPSSDCEDRSILYSILVRRVLDLDTVYVTFPGHVATAVGFRQPGRASGESYTYKGRRYTLADPTYINASVGMKMPQFKNEKGKIVTLN